VSNLSAIFSASGVLAVPEMSMSSDRIKVFTFSTKIGAPVKQRQSGEGGFEPPDVRTKT
jgi:hypothetical protein